MLSSGWRKSLPDNPPVSEAQDLVRYLNRFELVAVAIFENAMDEKIYKFARRTDYVKAWDVASRHMEERQKGAWPKANLENLERLAKNWDS